MYYPASGTSMFNKPGGKVFVTDNFLGVDFYNTKNSIKSGRSFQSVNMLRNTPGKIRKRMGYEKVKKYADKINGITFLGKDMLIHSGTKLYFRDVLVYSSMRNKKSTVFSMNGLTYILDGANYLVLNTLTNSVSSVMDSAYIPTIKIGKNPDGSGGYNLEDSNILTQKWKEGFCSDGMAKSFQLCFSDISANVLSASVRTADGKGFVTANEKTDFTVNRQTGVVSFAVAPPKSAITGEDNVIISAKRNENSSDFKVNLCDKLMLFGDESEGQRVFVTGLSAYANYDYWSQSNNPEYFGEYSYNILGNCNSAISGYCQKGRKLVAFKDKIEQKAYVRVPFVKNYTTAEGIVKTFHTFVVCDEVEFFGDIVELSFGKGGGEPLFLTSAGVFALANTNDDRNCAVEHRSFFADGKMLNESDIKKASCCNYKDFYIVCVGNSCYAFDLLQKSYDKNKPFSDFQYECFYLENIPAEVFAQNDEKLYFGTLSGEIFCFFTDEKNLASYNDNGNAINCFWQSGMIGSDLCDCKSINALQVSLGEMIRTEIESEYLYKGAWHKILKEPVKCGYFDFSWVDFRCFFFSDSNCGGYVQYALKLVKTPSVAIKISNKSINMPLILEKMAIEFA